uniref:Allophycocyanin subunit beta-18 n=1 Tax=Aglaothamnion neglectum TaxID=2765 RepID=APCF_AGLNE|nr:RecName: Full=Allophycocyanin subunit beta-18; Short=Allophycocyanin subunit B18 [Aglaothamnion neglectum]AAA18511.1 allophycocyanin b18 subunit [Aglaothamnion neglectum]
MQDTITNILNKYDLTGKYLDNNALTQITTYLNTALQRLEVVEIIQSQSSKIIKEAAARMYSEQPELLRPGGNSYTTRKYAMCLRDIEYYLRYATYAIIAGNNDILNERVLDGLKDTYNSLNVPIAPTVRSIQIMEEIIHNEISKQDLKIIKKSIISEPFDHMIQNLSEQDI